MAEALDSHVMVCNRSLSYRIFELWATAVVDNNEPTINRVTNNDDPDANCITCISAL